MWANKKFLQYFISTLVGITILVANLFFHEITAVTSLKEATAKVSDGALIASLLLICAGFLTLIGKSGFFDIMGYGFKSLRYLFSPNKRVLENRQTYYDYKVEKDEKGRKWCPFLCITGLFFLALAIILTIVYNLI